MKKGLVFFLIIGLLFCTACGAKQMTAEQTVQYYFKQYNKGNLEKANSVARQELQDAIVDIENVKSIKVRECVVDESNSSDTECIISVTIKIKLKRTDQLNQYNGTYDQTLRLERESPADDWMIAGWVLK